MKLKRNIIVYCFGLASSVFVEFDKMKHGKCNMNETRVLAEWRPMKEVMNAYCHFGNPIVVELYCRFSFFVNHFMTNRFLFFCLLQDSSTSCFPVQEMIKHNFPFISLLFLA